MELVYNHLIEETTFSTAFNFGLVRDVLGKDGVVPFEDNSITPKEGDRIKNTIYGSINQIFNNFDLTEKGEKKIADDYFKQNF